MKGLLPLFLFIFFSGWSLLAQIDWHNPVLQVTPYDGLPSTYYKGFAEDEFGFIWIATQKGICKFDGAQLHCIADNRLPQNGFTALEYDATQKTLWIGTVYGLYAYQLITDEVSKIKDNGIIKDNKILCLKKGKDQVLWIGTRNKFAKLEDGKDSIEIIPVPLGFDKGINNGFNEIYDILPDPVREDKLWLATQVGVVIYEISKGRFQEVEREIGNVDRLFINQIEIDPRTNFIYFGISNHADIPAKYNYLVYDSQAEKVVNSISLNENWKNKNISAFQNSQMLFSTSAGLIRYDPKTNTQVNSIDQPSEKQIAYQANYVDSKGNLWIGNHLGIAMYNSSQATGKSYYYDAQFPNWYHIVGGLSFDPNYEKAYLAVNGGEGLYEFDLLTKEWTIYPSLHEDGSVRKTNYRKVFFLEDGHIRILDQNGFFEINEGGEVVKSDFTIAGESVWAISFIDSYQTLWGINAHGFKKVNLKTKVTEEIRHQVHYCSVRSGNLEMFEDDRGNIWFGGMCDGFDVYDRDSGTFHNFDFPELYRETLIEFFAQQGELIWAVSSEGVIFKVNVHHPQKGVIEIVDLPDLLQERNVKLINSDLFDPGTCESGAFDRLGYFWLMTQQGIYRFDQSGFSLELFTKNVGVLVDDPDMNVYCAAFLSLLPDGKMLFTTRKGLCIFDPESITNNETIPQAYISAISVNNQAIEKDTSSLFKLTYELGARENFVGFDFSALDFSDPDKLKFQYKLEGVDEAWKDPGNKRYISYSQLNGGAYTFLLKAAGASGTWQENPVTVVLQIAKHWHQMAWARGLFLAIVIFGILFTYFSRLNRAIEKEHLKAAYERDLAELKMQALTAQMNPHFIFNSLNSIDFYIIKNDTRKASQYLNRFSKLIRLILKNSRSNYISLKDDLDALKLYLEIEALRFNHEFQYEINIDDQLDQDYIKIPPMLIQPYVENAIWHGLLHKKQDGKITINVHFDAERELIHCTILDNGIGRKRSMEAKAKEISKRKRKSFGMNITKDKIEVINFLHDLNASVNIIDLYDHQNQGAGTKVELSIPV